MVPAFSWKAGMVPAFSWKAVQRRPGLPASERIASEGDDQNGRIVVKLVAIGQTNATIAAAESRICRQWMATDRALPQERHEVLVLAPHGLVLPTGVGDRACRQRLGLHLKIDLGVAQGWQLRQ